MKRRPPALLARFARSVRTSVRAGTCSPWYIPPLADGETVIADLSGAPGTRVRLTDRRIVTGVIDTLIFVSSRDALSIPYAEITRVWCRSNLAAWEEPWGLCLELRSGGRVWLKLCKGHAQYAIRVIEYKISQEQAADGSL